MAGDRRVHPGQHDRRPRRAEGLHHRRLHGDGHRGHRGDRGRVRPAVRRRTRALREARGRTADLPRQGQPVGDHGARQSRRGAAGLRRAAAAGRLRPRRPGSASGRPHRVVRRRGRLELRGRGLPVGGLRLDLRQVVDQEAVLAGGRRRFGAAGGDRGAVRRRRRRFRDRRTRPGARHLPDRGGARGRRRRGGARGADRGVGPRGHRKPFARRHIRAGCGPASEPRCAG